MFKRKFESTPAYMSREHRESICVAHPTIKTELTFPVYTNMNPEVVEMSQLRQAICSALGMEKADEHRIELFVVENNVASPLGTWIQIPLAWPINLRPLIGFLLVRLTVQNAWDSAVLVKVAGNVRLLDALIDLGYSPEAAFLHGHGTALTSEELLRMAVSELDALLRAVIHAAP